MIGILRRWQKPQLAVVATDAGATIAQTIGGYDVDELPNLAVAMAEANARETAEWSARRNGLCLACNGKQHDACEGTAAQGGPCQCFDRFHVFGSTSAVPVRVGPAVDVPGTHRSCREAAARVCACCAPLIEAAAYEDLAVVDLGCMACGDPAQGSMFCLRCDIREDTKARRREDAES